MKNTNFSTIAALLAAVTLTAFSCGKEKEQEPSPVVVGQAKGKITALLPFCVGGTYIIELERPANFGVSGIYSYWGEIQGGPVWEYENAIQVPSFSKSQPEGRENITESILGAEITFDYRIKTDNDYQMFEYDGGCTQNLEPPAIPVYVVTKIY